MEKLIYRLLIKDSWNLFRLLKPFMELLKNIKSKDSDGSTIFLSKVSMEFLLTRWV